eukprot:GHVR01034927.1.p1 GENE.GHVR01034927.1~~GHVR01034927.1.p1  ORF type:complete len:117 (-),score=13.13 GHVR01034927.1:337-687(-)
MPTVPINIIEEVTHKDVKQGVLVSQDGLSKPGIVLGQPGKKSVKVAWLEENTDGMWKPKEIANAPISKEHVKMYFDFQEGTLPDEVKLSMNSLERDKKTQESTTTTLALIANFKGG